MSLSQLIALKLASIQVREDLGDEAGNLAHQAYLALAYPSRLCPCGHKTGAGNAYCEYCGGGR